MDGLRGVGRFAGLLLFGMLLLPGLAPWPAAVLDRGPDGSPRASAFPAALAAFDPSVLACARNGAAVAGLVAAGSIGLGVALGHASGTRRFRARWPLALAGKVPLAAGPLLVAPGIALVVGGDSGWDWLAARSVLGLSGEGLARWAALTWSGLAWGVPMVALATESALRRVEPSWSEAARAAGASPARAWRDATWPAIRPEVARAAASVFTLALVEPAGPLALGLRRTLAAQMIAAADRLDQPTRAATLAVLSIAIAAVGRAVLLRWGGTPCLGDGPEPPPPIPRAARARALASAMALGGWALIGAGPVVALLWRATDPEQGMSLGRWSGLLARDLADPEAQRWAANSVTAGLASLGVALLALGAVGGRASRRLVGVFEAVPPLSLAVGALSIPWLLGALGDSIGGEAGRRLLGLARELAPARWPGWLLILAVAAGRLPTLAAAADRARSRARPSLTEAALLMGASRSRARRAGQNRWLGIVPARPVVLSIALASTALAPALLLAPGSERRTLPSAVLVAILEGEPPAPGPVAAILVVNLAGFALASRGRSGPLGDWFRG